MLDSFSFFDRLATSEWCNIRKKEHRNNISC